MSGKTKPEGGSQGGTGGKSRRGGGGGLRGLGEVAKIQNQTQYTSQQKRTSSESSRNVPRTAENSILRKRANSNLAQIGGGTQHTT